MESASASVRSLGHDRKGALLGKTTWAWIGGFAIVLGAVVGLLLFVGGPAFLLHREEVEAVRHHLRLRDQLAALDARIAAGEAAADPALVAERAVLRARVAGSVFAARSREALESALEAADAGTIARGDDEVMRGVYGEDDRTDRSQVKALLGDPRWGDFTAEELDGALAQAKGVGAWIHVAHLEPQGDAFRVKAKTLGAAWKLCPKERFAQQPLAALGTAFLVRSDVVVTAAHVLAGVELDQLVLAFDFEMGAGVEPIVVRQTARPTAILGSDAGNGTFDWALVRLDRRFPSEQVLTLAPSSQRRALHRRVYMWGHSAGTPKKWVPGTIQENDARSRSIRVRIDAFNGDSGSPLFNEHDEVVGLLYGGSNDFAYAQRAGCATTWWLPRTTLGEYVTRLEEFAPSLPP